MDNGQFVPSAPSIFLSKKARSINDPEPVPPPIPANRHICVSPASLPIFPMAIFVIFAVMLLATVVTYFISRAAGESERYKGDNINYHAENNFSNKGKIMYSFIYCLKCQEKVGYWLSQASIKEKEMINYLIICYYFFKL